MIHILEKKNCVGCEACVQVCPKKCISFIQDEEGFLYPIVDVKNCIVCNLCEKVCPTINFCQERKPLKIYALINKDSSDLFCSSSGAIFPILARLILKKNGVVVGASFDNDWTVRHKVVTSNDELSALLGSKYVQSRIGNTYICVKKKLDEGKYVLFTGTPCQIAGLKHFLRKDYLNLLLVEVVCHSVPSPMVWNDYLNYVSNGSIKDVINVQFRNKILGWFDYSVVIDGVDNHYVNESRFKNIYIQGFLHDIYCRPSCHACKMKKFSSGSDLTIGDFWGVSKVKRIKNYYNGVSLCYVNTIKGGDFLREIKDNFDVYLLNDIEIEKGNVLRGAVSNVIPANSKRTEFWECYLKCLSLPEKMKIIKKYSQDKKNIKKMVKFFLKRFVKFFK